MADCPTPWKVAYPSPQKAHAQVERNPTQEKYACPGGHWHVTTKARTHDLAKSGKATYRNRWAQAKLRRKMFRKRT